MKLPVECININSQAPRHERAALSVAAEIGDVGMAALLLDIIVNAAAVVGMMAGDPTG